MTSKKKRREQKSFLFSAFGQIDWQNNLDCNNLLCFPGEKFICGSLRQTHIKLSIFIIVFTLRIDIHGAV